MSAVFASDQVYTTGTVVRVDRAGTTSSQASRPVIEYAVDGRHERFYGGANNLHGLHCGDTVPIAYSRSDRSTAHLRSFSDEFLLPLMMTVFGLPFLALAVSGTINNVRRS